jgi:hypothetical protein
MGDACLKCQKLLDIYFPLAKAYDRIAEQRLSFNEDLLEAAKLDVELTQVAQLRDEAWRVFRNHLDREHVERTHVPQPAK